jgi:hypothetical protein
MGRTVLEYKDPDLFFKKAYITEGLKILVDVVEKRLKGQGGDPVIQIQTPFGGGKTHALITLYHRVLRRSILLLLLLLWSPAYFVSSFSLQAVKLYVGSIFGLSLSNKYAKIAYLIFP